MTTVNTAKPTTSVVNLARPADGETWASIATTWASELESWAESGSFLDNVARVSSSMTNVAKP